jgi:hypothetical protein
VMENNKFNHREKNATEKILLGFFQRFSLHRFVGRLDKLELLTSKSMVNKLVKFFFHSHIELFLGTGINATTNGE